jgi:hypothetical protein
MGQWWNIFGAKAEPSTRYVVATRQESMAAQRRRTDKMLELAVYVATTSNSQRKAETEAYFASIRPHHVNEQVGEGTH